MDYTTNDITENRKKQTLVIQYLSDASMFYGLVSFVVELKSFVMTFDKSINSASFIAFDS